MNTDGREKSKEDIQKIRTQCFAVIHRINRIRMGPRDVVELEREVAVLKKMIPQLNNSLDAAGATGFAMEAEADVARLRGNYKQALQNYEKVFNHYYDIFQVCPCKRFDTLLTLLYLSHRIKNYGKRDYYICLAEKELTIYSTAGKEIEPHPGGYRRLKTNLLVCKLEIAVSENKMDDARKYLSEILADYGSEENLRKLYPDANMIFNLIPKIRKQ